MTVLKKPLYSRPCANKFAIPRKTCLNKLRFEQVREKGRKTTLRVFLQGEA